MWRHHRFCVPPAASGWGSTWDILLPEPCGSWSIRHHQAWKISSECEIPVPVPVWCTEVPEQLEAWRLLAVSLTEKRGVGDFTLVYRKIIYSSSEETLHATLTAVVRWDDCVVKALSGCCILQNVICLQWRCRQIVSIEFEGAACLSLLIPSASNSPEQKSCFSGCALVYPSKEGR